MPQLHAPTMRPSPGTRNPRARLPDRGQPRCESRVCPVPLQAAASYVLIVMEDRIDVGPEAADQPPRAATATRARAVPATLLVAALVGFLLPFATVSCGTPVTFTGLELATASVPAQGQDEHEFADVIESDGTLVGAIALVAVALALGLVALGLRGWGAAAATGMLALLLLPWLAALAAFEIHAGYVISTGALAVAVGIERVASFARRRTQRRRAWPAVVAGIVLAVPLVVTLVFLAGTQQSV